MKKSIYLYLQRYLVKVLNNSCTYEKYNIVLAAPLLNTIRRNEGVNFFKNRYIKKSIGFDFDFSLLSSNYLVNQTFFFKTSQRRGFFSFSFVKNNNQNCNYTINNTIIILIKGTEYLYKENLGGNSRCFNLITFLKLRKKAKLVSKLMVCHKQIIFCYFQKNKTQNLLNFLSRVKIRKIKYFSSLKSFLNLALFLSQQLSFNKESELIYLNTLCYMVFPFQSVHKNFRIFTKTLLRDKTLIIVTSLFLLVLKYVKKEKFIQFMEYKAFVYLVNRVHFYWFCQTNPAIIENKVTQRVLTTTAINSQFCCLRPLFSLTRLDTFYICESLKLPIYPDQSNFRVDFLRNRVRKQILPAIRILINPQFDTILCKFNELSN